MKKTVLKLIALVMMAAMVFSLTSCLFTPKPKLDLKEAKKNLENEDYTVVHDDDSDELGIEETLSAYSGDKDDSDSLYIIVFEKTKLAKLRYDSIKLMIDTQVEEYKAEIEALEIELKALEYTLKKYEDDMKSDEIDALEEEIKETEDNIKDLEKELKDFKEETVVGRSGKTVWFGTKDAIKDSKG